MFTKNSQNSQQIFSCDKCNYFTSKKNDYNKHITTLKHKKQQNVYQCLPTGDKSTKQRICEDCGKKYSCKQSLYVHKKVCIQTKEDDDQIDLNSIDSNLVIQLLKQNDEFKSMLLEQNSKMLETFQEACKNNNTNITNNVNSHNKAFNLNVFLNEECKDAMSITDFVNSIKLQLTDLEAVGKLGFVNGISDIIIKNLKALDVHKRPIHCTDTKRETMYVKGAEAWVKEGDDNKQLRLAIKRVARNNFICLELFRAKHPDCVNWDSKHGDHYQKLRIEALGGRGNEDCDNEDKIIRRIARETTIDKSL